MASLPPATTLTDADWRQLAYLLYRVERYESVEFTDEQDALITLRSMVATHTRGWRPDEPVNSIL